MSVQPEKFTVDTNERDTVTALLYRAPAKEREAVTLILGHGAGADQMSPFMRLFADGLAQRGFDTVTFNFLYMEQGKRLPDKNAKLESCYRAVISAAQSQKKMKGNRLVIGGKSMGGRIASQVAALECADLSALSKAATGRRTPNSELTAGAVAGAAENNIAGMVFLGYPLHPPGRPDKLRDAHLKDIKAPMLFIQGSRDAFGSTDEIRAVIKRLKLPATLHALEGGDHSLKVPKSTGLMQPQVYESIMDGIADWLRLKLS